ncbi:lysophospholipase [Kribbella sp. DT2]|uniref:alpha/beta hydrolase n=1 Tax=Kribbella sp. DT2 TaxID=3393427 RepID=UPI003CF20B85
MTETSLELEGETGAIHVRVWGAAEPAYSVVLAHGIGEHSGRYVHLAQRLVGDDAVVYAGDHHGHGKSDGDRMEIEDVDVMVRDLHLVVDRMRADHPGLPLVLIGHSLGGLISTRFVQLYPGELTVLVLTDPFVGGNPAFEGLLAMDPMPSIPIDPGMLSRDPATGEDYLADPLVHHGPLTRKTLNSVFASVSQVAEGPSFGDLPTLWLHGELDPLAPYDVTVKAFEHLAGSSLEQKMYEGAKHEILNETNKDEVIGDVLTFVRKQLGR